MVEPEAELARLKDARAGLHPRRHKGRGANPFRMNPRYHGFRRAMAVWATLRENWDARQEGVTDDVWRPGKRVYERAAKAHAAECDDCQQKRPSWKRVQGDWLKFRPAITRMMTDSFGAEGEI